MAAKGLKIQLGIRIRKFLVPPYFFHPIYIIFWILHMDSTNYSYKHQKLTSFVETNVSMLRCTNMTIPIYNGVSVFYCYKFQEFKV